MPVLGDLGPAGAGRREMPGSHGTSSSHCDGRPGGNRGVEAAASGTSEQFFFLAEIMNEVGEARAPESLGQTPILCLRPQRKLINTHVQGLHLPCFPWQASQAHPFQNLFKSYLLRMGPMDLVYPGGSHLSVSHSDSRPQQRAHQGLSILSAAADASLQVSPSLSAPSVQTPKV